MRRVLLTLALVAAGAAGLSTGFGATGAFAHNNGCHSRHTCPSDHHTYIWYDAAGKGWDCARPGADEYNPAADTTSIVYDSLPYWCHAAGAAPPATTTTSTAKRVSQIKIPVGRTVLMKTRTQSAGCTLANNPDRQCSPGAYYIRLTKPVICSPSFHTSDVRDVPTSLKHDVEIEYGLPPKAYGRTLEIDHIISLELGGSNDVANLFPEKAPGYHAKDKLENRLHKLVCSGAMTLRAAQVDLARNWQALYARVYDGPPIL